MRGLADGGYRIRKVGGSFVSEGGAHWSRTRTWRRDLAGFLEVRRIPRPALLPACCPLSAARCLPPCEPRPASRKPAPVPSVCRRPPSSCPPPSGFRLQAPGLLPGLLFPFPACHFDPNARPYILPSSPPPASPRILLAVPSSVLPGPSLGSLLAAKRPLFKASACPPPSVAIR